MISLLKSKNTMLLPPAGKAKPAVSMMPFWLRSSPGSKMPLWLTSSVKFWNDWLCLKSMNGGPRTCSTAST